MLKHKFYHQLDTSDCGPTCLRMICHHFGKKFSSKYLHDITYSSRNGISLLNISDAAERIGFKTLKLGLTIDQLVENGPLPAILYWKERHFVVLYEVKSHRNREKTKFVIADPAAGLISTDLETFRNGWIPKRTEQRLGYALFLEPTEAFQKQKDNQTKKGNASFLFKYLIRYKKFFLQLVFGMFSSSVLALIFPFLTQSIVDYGIKWKDTNFITLILLVQLFIFAGNISIEFIRSQLVLHIGTRINISIISDFLLKLTRLPLSYFDAKHSGDLLTRVDDHKRIETFLTSSVLNTVFSIFNLIILLIVLFIYSAKVFLIVFVGSMGSILWLMFFMRKRKQIDYKIFMNMSEDKDNLYEIINGMQEIKLNGMEQYKRWGWEKTQLKLFQSNNEFLRLEQFQQIGTGFFTQLRNILVTFFTATAVIDGGLTIGMLVSISYITGQLNSPISKIISFFKLGQDALISFERLSDVYSQVDEENGKAEETEAANQLLKNASSQNDQHLNGHSHLNAIRFENVSFQYEGPNSSYVLKDLSLEIPLNKVTAIVGVSGSGKTTLVKLLMRFYNPTKGKILVGKMNLKDVSPKWWRDQCGAVMQDGYIFNDTIARNVAANDEKIDLDRMHESLKIANIDSFVSSIPREYLAKIGETGKNLSVGQKQRILIARAAYKVPSILIFDEATSSLDATNEKTIIENLNRTFENKTVVVVAHRLSTVKNADKIVVLDDGRIIEQGNHEELTRKKGGYYSLVKNQLELGN